ncbi:phosphatidylinositol N-acetylglucosaminyltransferase subunit P isoform X1 [Melitaea cinxia]|uniref:phosphatidylinositol N-acetylglucosaminyltransferase subunit P isoform X1 n=1 Tax=Melitaea cinxia TaxID=113334 RepID=UPI001E271E3B|nr:phosphatidylinositol N-acetylglucosaminyltransferase subunit P isoform X1 [Melitaea cinxia]
MPEHTPAPTPARSLYGFFMYLFSKTILAIYCIWTIIPDSYLHYLKIYYYPQKYWSIAVPIQCLVGLTMFAFLVYPSSNLMLTTKIDSLSSIHDSFSQVGRRRVENRSTTNHSCICINETKCMKHTYLASAKELKENTVPKLEDLDIRFVCKKLYMYK